MQRRLEEERAAREQDVKDKDERVLTLTGELQSLQDELKSLKSQVSAVKSAVLGYMLPDLEACLHEHRELEAYFTEMERKSSEAVKFKVRRVGASDPAWRKIVFTPESHDMFQELARRVSQVFGLADEGLYFQYQDEEGDPISVHSNIEIKEAMRQFAPKCPKLTFQETASDKVVAKAGAPTEKKKDGDEHDTHE